jgi:hypothetical protein
MMPQQVLIINIIKMIRSNMKMKILLYISLVACAIFVHFPKTYGQDEVCNNPLLKAGAAGRAADIHLRHF